MTWVKFNARHLLSRHFLLQHLENNFLTCTTKLFSFASFSKCQTLARVLKSFEGDWGSLQHHGIKKCHPFCPPSQLRVFDQIWCWVRMVKSDHILALIGCWLSVVKNECTFHCPFPFCAWTAWNFLRPLKEHRGSSSSQLIRSFSPQQSYLWNTLDLIILDG